MRYVKRELTEISFPLGGIGTGSIGLKGNGGFVDWEIFNRPDKDSINGYTHFAVRASTPVKHVEKVLAGDLVKDLTGTYSKKDFAGFGYGPDSKTMCGFPHFSSVTFKGEFPIAELDFEDAAFPGKVKLTAFNPFIPLEADDSSLPCAMFTLSITNDTDYEIDYQGALSVANPFPDSVNKLSVNDSFSAVKLFSDSIDPKSAEYGDLTALVCCENAGALEYWYRGNWQDGIVSYKNDFALGRFASRHYDEPGKGDTCTVYGGFKLKKGETKSLKFIISWSCPNRINYWSPIKDEFGKDLTWKNYYATVFADSLASATYSIKNFDSLYAKTNQFRTELFSSTLPRRMLEAVSANLSVLKSPVVVRLENGEFYAWEGANEQSGACEGTCMHVWNYAYALCFLFPSLERSIRDLEFKYQINDDGKATFRLTLPIGREPHGFRACVDGQMGTVIKCYREWKLSGDDEWLRGKWDKIKKIIAYAWSEKNPDKWDADKDGILEGRQHHTLDVELFGATSWLQGMYLAALKAGAIMAEHFGEKELAKDYTAMYNNGVKYTDDNLFNGSYYVQRTNLKDKSVCDKFDCSDYYWNDEEKEIKYQLGEGCEIDQLLGEWHAGLCGLGEIFDKGHVDSTLKAIYNNNFKKTLRNFTNPWRIFALNDEAGTIMCEYPEGTVKPRIPVPYCEECMTGFEYAFAGTLASRGYIGEAKRVVSAVRDRYDGVKRNPFNEIECGSNYARSMASYALMPIFSGFSFDLPEHSIGFNPVEKRKVFRAVWSVDSAWGNVIKHAGRTEINILHGSLTLSSLCLPYLTAPLKMRADGKPVAFAWADGKLCFPKITVLKSIVIR